MYGRVATRPYALTLVVRRSIPWGPLRCAAPLRARRLERPLADFGSGEGAAPQGHLVQVARKTAKAERVDAEVEVVVRKPVADAHGRCRLAHQRAIHVQ